MKVERNDTEPPASGALAQGSALSVDPGTNQVVAKTLPIALIGGFGGKGGRATGPDGQGGEGGFGEGNNLPSAVLYYLEEREKGVAGGVGGEGGEGKFAGRGGKAGGNQVHHNNWYFGDTTAVATLGIKEFCADHLLNDACKYLEEYGITTANALFDLEDEDITNLLNSGLKRGQIAGLRNALKKLVAQSKA